jgi:hypothetical protein
MRENLDLYKDNMKILREQNEELQQKLANQSVGCSSEMMMSGQIKELFEGLKEDNMRLADEVKSLKEENQQVQSYLGVSKETIQQQNGIINNLNRVIESLQIQIA